MVGDHTGILGAVVFLFSSFSHLKSLIFFFPLHTDDHSLHTMSTSPMKPCPEVPHLTFFFHPPCLSEKKTSTTIFFLASLIIVSISLVKHIECHCSTLVRVFYMFYNYAYLLFLLVPLFFPLCLLLPFFFAQLHQGHKS